MSAKADRSGVIFRPHFKTHQSIEVGRWFRQIGTQKITVSSMRMANYFADDGWNDITVAFPVNLREIETIRALSGRIELGLLVEDPFVTKTLLGELNHEVNIWIKLDTGYHRTGLEMKDVDAIAEIIHVCNASRTGRFQGFLTHAGHTYHTRQKQDVLDIYEESLNIMQSVRKGVEHLSDDIALSWGDTPSCSRIDDLSGMDEIRPGNFVFYDLMQWLNGNCSFENIAGVVACPVVAKHSATGEVVVYGGAVHLSKERYDDYGETIFGRVVNLTPNAWSYPVEGAAVVSLSQEHGVIRAPDSWITQIQVGDLVGVVPVHSCLTVNLSSDMVTTAGQKLSHFRSI